MTIKKAKSYVQISSLSSEPIRKITVAALYTRLSDKFPVILSLADAATAQGDYSLKAELMKLDKAEYADLDNKELKAGFKATGQFTDEELDAVFVDGQPHEVPEALKK